MKEYGGYLELESYYEKEYHENAIALNTARNCLRLIIRKYKIKEILLPRYLCSCIVDVCLNENVKIYFYSIDHNLKPKLDSLLELSNNMYLYIINYYGQLSNKYIIDLKTKFRNIIVDNVQDFFRKPVEGVDTIYTCRKYFGVTDGAYLYTSQKIYTADLEKDCSYKRFMYLLGRFEKNGNEFFHYFLKNEKILEKENIKLMSKVTHNLMKSINYNRIIKKRKKNFEILDYYLNSFNELTINNYAGLFLYPLLKKNGKQIKERLIEEKIYVPTLWPGVENIAYENSFERRLVSDLILLPIDQRYDEGDMHNMLVLLNNILKGCRKFS